MNLCAAASEIPINNLGALGPKTEGPLAPTKPDIEVLARRFEKDPWLDKLADFNLSDALIRLGKKNFPDKLRRWARVAIDTANSGLGAKNLGGKPNGEIENSIDLPLGELPQRPLPNREWTIQQATTPKIEVVDGGPNIDVGEEAISYCGDSNANNVGNERFDVDQQQRINQEFGVSNLLTGGNPDRETVLRHLASRWVQVEEMLDKNGRGPLMGGLLRMELQLKDAIHEAIQNKNEMALVLLDRELLGLQIAQENPGSFTSPDGITPVDAWAQNRISTLQVVVEAWKKQSTSSP